MAEWKLTEGSLPIYFSGLWIRLCLPITSCQPGILRHYPHTDITTKLLEANASVYYYSSEGIYQQFIIQRLSGQRSKCLSQWKALTQSLKKHFKKLFSFKCGYGQKNDNTKLASSSTDLLPVCPCGVKCADFSEKIFYYFLFPVALKSYHSSKKEIWILFKTTHPKQYC